MYFRYILEKHKSLNLGRKYDQISKRAVGYFKNCNKANPTAKCSSTKMYSHGSLCCSRSARKTSPGLFWFHRDHWLQCSKGREGSQPAAFVFCCGGGPGVLSSAVQGLRYPATSSSSSTDRFPTLRPNKTKSALTLQNVDEFFRVNQPCQPDVELSPTCDII